MMRFNKIVSLLLLPVLGSAQQQQTSTDSLQLETITVTSTLASEKMPFSKTEITEKFIRKQDFGQDIPYLLRQTPSLVETSDAGTGIGYTSLRIRGTDASRINVTIDGIPLNDSESQNVYWVDLPDFAASSDRIQLQRGIGTSTNGAGAFGATVNLQTDKTLKIRTLRYDGGYGSFNTQRHSLNYYSGVLKNKFYLRGRLSKTNSDGFIDRASSDLNGWHVSATYFTPRTSLKIKNFGGHEVTYQAWSGVPAQYLQARRRFNPEGTEKKDEPHKNQVDDYKQNHTHLILNHVFTNSIKSNISLHYTHGAGFYEQYKANQKLVNYKFPQPYVVNNLILEKSDLVRRLWLNNDFYGGIYTFMHETKQLEATWGGAYNEYYGGHFGEVVQLLANPSQKPVRFYENQAVKKDFNTYFKLNYHFNQNFNGFADVQFRNVQHDFTGSDKNDRNLTQNTRFNFWNPKVGLNYDAKSSKFYGSFAVGNREPSRDDLVSAPRGTAPKPEQLFNTEIGYKYLTNKYLLAATFYNMYYNNQLVLTGQINDVGNPIRMNIPKSYRTGLELEGRYAIDARWELNVNASFSMNKALNFTEYRDNWDSWGQDTFYHGTTNLAFSPSFIGNFAVAYQILKTQKQDFSATFQHKTVGKQYSDNTNNELTALNSYHQSDLKLFYTLHTKKIKTLTFKLLINNLFNQQFSSNAWVYRFTSANYDPRPDDPFARSESTNRYHLMGYFPQAGTNLTLGVSIEL